MAFSKARRLASLMGAGADIPEARRPTIALVANTVDTDQYVDDSIELVHMKANSVDSAQYVDGSIDLEHMSSESIDEDNLQISNAGTNGQYLQKSSNTGGLTWADVSAGLTLVAAQTTGFTAEAGKQYLCDTSGGAFAIQLPTGGVGDTIGIIDYNGDFDTNNLTLTQDAATGSEKIFRADADGTIDTKNWSTSIKYMHATVGWLPAGD